MGRRRGWKGRERGRESDYVRLVFRVVCLGWRAWREMSWREMSWREMSWREKSWREKSWREIISPLSAPGSGLKVERGGLRGEEGGKCHCPYALHSLPHSKSSTLCPEPCLYAQAVSTQKRRPEPSDRQSERMHCRRTAAYGKRAHGNHGTYARLEDDTFPNDTFPKTARWRILKPVGRRTLLAQCHSVGRGNCRGCGLGLSVEG